MGGVDALPAIRIARIAKSKSSARVLASWNLALAVPDHSTLDTRHTALETRSMAFESFRDFLNQLQAAGELRKISEPIATELEITELADREMKSPNGGKALLIEKPTVNGVVSPFPVAINTMGSHKRMAMSMGANSVDEVAAEIGALMKAKPPTTFRQTLRLLGQALELRHARPKIVSSG